MPRLCRLVWGCVFVAAMLDSFSEADEFDQTHWHKQPHWPGECLNFDGSQPLMFLTLFHDGISHHIINHHKAGRKKEANDAAKRMCMEHCLKFRKWCLAIELVGSHVHPERKLPGCGLVTDAETFFKSGEVLHDHRYGAWKYFKDDPNLYQVYCGQPHSLRCRTSAFMDGHWNKKKGYTCMLAKHFPVLNHTMPTLKPRSGGGGNGIVPERRKKVKPVTKKPEDKVDDLAQMKNNLAAQMAQLEARMAKAEEKRANRMKQRVRPGSKKKKAPAPVKKKKTDADA